MLMQTVREMGDYFPPPKEDFSGESRRDIFKALLTPSKPTRFQRFINRFKTKDTQS